VIADTATINQIILLSQHAVNSLVQCHIFQTCDLIIQKGISVCTDASFHYLLFSSLLQTLSLQIFLKISFWTKFQNPLSVLL